MTLRPAAEVAREIDHEIYEHGWAVLSQHDKALILKAITARDEEVAEAVRESCAAEFDPCGCRGNVVWKCHACRIRALPLAKILGGER